jgi:PAS domain-containing protein
MMRGKLPTKIARLALNIVGAGVGGVSYVSTLDAGGMPGRQAIWDIAEPRRVEEALRESGGRLRRSVLDAPIPIMIHAEDGEVLMIGKKWSELSGYSHADIPTILDWTEKAYGAHKEQMRDLVGGLCEIQGPFEDGAQVTTAWGERRT